ncbi:MAG: response regulator [Lachnospiraceae bacterium]|nr:response regulator [Lachnospiraceae bacterium]
MKVLIVEDEELEYQAIIHLLNLKYPAISKILTAQDGEKAVYMAVTSQPDLIFMDINLPVLNGMEAAKQIRRQLPDSKIIMVTAYSDFEYLRESIRIQALDYIVKPYSADTFYESVDRALQDHSDSMKLYGKKSSIERIKKYLEQHYSENITLQDIADEVCLEKSYLGRLFREECQMTVMTCLRKIRIEKASELLMRGMSAGEVAEKTGFGDQAYFGKSFKQATGISPAKYRDEKIKKTFLS